MNAIRLYFRFVALSFRAQLVYRVSFVMYAFANALSSAVDFVAVYAFFRRFGRLGQWSLWETAIFYGMANMALALSESYMRGFDIFDRMVRTGDFDRILARPRTTFLQMMGSNFQLLRVGRFLTGLLAAAWGIAQLGLAWRLTEWALFILSVLSGSLLFSGVILVRAAVCFWTNESLEVFNMATYGGVETGQYPLDIYEKHIRRIFSGVIPLAAINYWPLSLLLHRAYVPAALSWLSPAFGPVCFLLGLLAWRIGERKYRSTGS